MNVDYDATLNDESQEKNKRGLNYANSPPSSDDNNDETMAPLLLTFYSINKDVTVKAMRHFFFKCL